MKRDEQNATELRRVVGSDDNQLRTHLAEIPKPPQRFRQGNMHATETFRKFWNDRCKLIYCIQS